MANIQVVIVQCERRSSFILVQMAVTTAARSATLANMETIHDTEELTTEVVTDDDEYEEFLRVGSSGVYLKAEQFGESAELALRSDGGDFLKWAKETSPEIKLGMQEVEKRLVLKSADIWIPLAYLASDITIPVYLNILANYLYDRLRGSIGSNNTKIHFSAVYKESDNGTTKKLTFSGNADALEKVIKKFDANSFLDKE